MSASTHLGSYLRALREARGLTTRQLGKAAGCSHSFITYIETGERSPKLDLLWYIMEAVGGNFGQALYLLCLDMGIPQEVIDETITVVNKE